MLANIFQSLKTAPEIDEDLGRHMILNSLRLINVKFGREYGEMVICCDSNKFWRKEEFPYYKANRKKARDDSTINWKKVFEIINTIKSELNEFFPYRVVEFSSAEADDVIGVLASEWSLDGINNGNRILIVSGDKDFIQLQRFPNVEQWDPINKKKIVHNDPMTFLKEHIIRGDVGDGIPNFMSAGNSLVMGIRQKPITKKVIEKCFSSENPSDFCEGDSLEYFKRNTVLIDLSNIPGYVREGILNEFKSQEQKGKSKMLKYFMDKRLSNLLSNINDF